MLMFFLAAIVNEGLIDLIVNYALQLDISIVKG